MVLRIRLARFGTKRAPVYNIVLAQAKSARGKKPIEVLGTYDPIPRLPLATPDTPEYLADGSTKFVPRRYKDIKLDASRTKYWLGVGAQPTEPVVKLLSMIGLIEPKPSSASSSSPSRTMPSSSPSTESIPTQQQQKPATTATA
ncbi:ribosomal protein S16 [Exophiala oligosperma]|uniref:Ribosomal protein S16 n=1 Tax=Exophiala oligosperma TaxID=215243 RepID=A0A0D2ADJ6_9EURO|nr:ribosomal protein S16 [Exophiala oligosperma]KIW38281.1 ribosomal protein S16 [Exophiala oligosperma]